MTKRHKLEASVDEIKNQKILKTGSFVAKNIIDAHSNSNIHTDNTPERNEAGKSSVPEGERNQDILTAGLQWIVPAAVIVFLAVFIVVGVAVAISRISRKRRNYQFHDGNSLDFRQCSQISKTTKEAWKI